MARGPEALAGLGAEAEAVLEVARDIAVRQFGIAAVQEIPRLVTDVALVMAVLQTRGE